MAEILKDRTKDSELIRDGRTIKLIRTFYVRGIEGSADTILWKGAFTEGLPVFMETHPSDAGLVAKYFRVVPASGTDVWVHVTYESIEKSNLYLPNSIEYDATVQNDPRNFSTIGANGVASPIWVYYADTKSNDTTAPLDLISDARAGLINPLTGDSDTNAERAAIVAEWAKYNATPKRLSDRVRKQVGTIDATIAVGTITAQINLTGSASLSTGELRARIRDWQKEYVNTVNSTMWDTYPKHTLLCTNIKAHRMATSFLYDVTIQFAYKKTGWYSYAMLAFEDGVPRANQVKNFNDEPATAANPNPAGNRSNGFTKVLPYDESNFNLLPINLL